MKVRLGHIEAAVVLFTLCIIACAGGGKFTDWSAAAAVFIGFLHAQLAFDIADNQPKKNDATEPQRLRDLFIIKEVVWILTFASMRSYPLLAGALMFFVYPTVRYRLRSFVARSESTAEIVSVATA